MWYVAEKCLIKYLPEIASIDMPLKQTPRETPSLKCRQGGGGGGGVRTHIKSFM